MEALTYTIGRTKGSGERICTKRLDNQTVNQLPPARLKLINVDKDTLSFTIGQQRLGVVTDREGKSSSY